MSQLFTLPLPVLATAGSAQSVMTRDMQNKWVQFTAPFTGSLTVEVSLDNGNTFVAAGAAVTAPGLVSVPQPATHVRVTTGSLSAGTPAAVIAGFYNAEG